jgi:hypothetical protein
VVSRDLWQWWTYLVLVIVMLGDCKVPRRAMDDRIVVSTGRR